jgi:ATP-dependent RNA helicase RhlE
MTYNNNDRNGSFQSRSGGFGGGRPSGGGNRGNGGGSRGGFGGNRGGGGRSGGRGKKPFGEHIDPNKYTRVAKPVTIEEYKPEFNFSQMGLRPDVLSAIEHKGYKQPSPIQDKAIPHVMAGKDVIGLAATGTGKTAAFLIPLLHKTLEKNNKTTTLIVCPTRELAIQIEEELFRLKHRDMDIFATVLVGGMDIRPQIRKLRMTNQFLIGTPGRIKDLIQKGLMQLDKVESVVLDEVDRMLDMGFLDDVTFIVNQLPKDRQSLFFSATVDPKQERIIQQLTKDPITVQVSSMGTSSDNVHQSALIIEPHMKKYDSLVEILRGPEVGKCLIFSRTKHGADRLARDLDRDGFPVGALHGDMSQGQRKRMMDDFKNDRVLALVATDIAARGIDVKDVTHVINYDEPATHDEYIHRIGRTGRAGTTGHSITFVEKGGSKR